MASAPRRMLGLDVSKKTGYALAEGNKFVQCGVWDLSIKSHEHYGQQGINFYNALVGIGYVDEIYYEVNPFSGNFKNKKGDWISPSSDGKELFHGLLMIMNLFAATYDIDTYPVNGATLKKAFCGHGGAQKADMCAVARSLGWRGGQANTALHDDEADAIALVETQMRLKYGIRVTF